MTESVERPEAEDADQAAAAPDQTPLDDVVSPDDSPSLIHQIVEMEQLVAERTEDLQRVQAEYVNYKKRVDRDRARARQSGIEAVLNDLMPVFDSILAAESHDDLTGGFKLTADELVKVTRSYGFESFGAPGDEFDPHLHEALMQMPDPDVETMAIKEVMQVGYRINDYVLRPARVIVAVPEDA
ncbi:MAG: nucleotide exchange factor GrpE [Brooklawnia sp.]|jgi:molecular chaperone GrpE